LYKITSVQHTCGKTLAAVSHIPQFGDAASPAGDDVSFNDECSINKIYVLFKRYIEDRKAKKSNVIKEET